ncbi:crotonase/enoyl-CoA hydratase family protein [uncultured Microbacterium sp.]|uniref:crotonase/enoyl-CoA hydratase family protein n=1 Tax=uncultured Microbacterium sp. TaxID=191216 RepID=UPI0035CC9FD1
MSVADEALYEVHAHVAVVTLNRPAAMNAVNEALSIALGAAMERASADPEVRVVVLTGSGTRAFCAGMDLKAFARGESAEDPAHPEWGFGGFVRHAIDKPVIAAVNGFALGGGSELVLACDLAIAGRSVMLGFPEVTRGLVAAAGGVIRLPRQIPRKLALEALLTGQPLSAERSRELGLINRVVDDGKVLASALSLAEIIAANAPLAVQASKRFVREADRFGSDWDDAVWAAHDDAIMPVFATDDAREGATAFAEKRSPQWTGR